MKRLVIIACLFALPITLVNAEPTTTDPKTWAGSNGVKQPTGFEVLGCPYYVIERGRMIILCEDPETKKAHNANGGLASGTAN